MKKSKEMMWAVLLHLGYNMWKEQDARYTDEDADYTYASDELLCDDNVWRELTDKMAEYGLNTLVIDLGEGVRYESHPELSVKGSWSKEKLKNEIKRLRDIGINAIPKLNFSACHDEWLGEYSRCVSTQRYYDVCRDIINEVIDLFDKPEYLHLGMDEETDFHQRHFNISIIRKGEAWWKDFYFFVDLVEKADVRSWIWSDYIWKNKEVFLRKMPKSVLQSNWYYDKSFSSEKENSSADLGAYKLLEEYGYDQVPTGSNWNCQENFERTVSYCKNNITPEHLKGFMQAPWSPTILQRRYYHLHALDLAMHAKKKCYG